MKKVLVSDKIDPAFISLLEKENFSVKYLPGITQEEILKIINEYNILVVRSSTKVSAEIIAQAENLELIGRAGAGVDNIVIKEASRSGIIVMNTPGGNTISAAEHTMTMMLALCRNVPQANQSLKEKKWERRSFSGTEVYGKTLGIIGLGKIGSEVAKRAAAFNMNIIGYDPFLSETRARKMGIKLVDIKKVYADADIITVHVPFSEKTKNLISEESLKLCKDGVKIINCARGGIVNENDLLKAVENGKVSGAALDVFEKEPPENMELVDHPNIISTPHLGASTIEAQEKVAIQLADQIIAYYYTNELKGAVNLPDLDLDESILTFGKLAYKMGELQAQLLNEKIDNLKISFSGKALHKHSQYLSLSVLSGLFSHLFVGPVNIVNAKLIAEERGIEIAEQNFESNEIYNNLISVNVITKNSENTISGTVLLNNDYRIVSFNDYDIEFKPEQNLLFYHNVDLPGVLAKVTNIMSRNKINIAGLALGRKIKGNKAITIINTDEKVDDTIIKEIEKLNEIFYVKRVIFG